MSSYKETKDPQSGALYIEVGATPVAYSLEIEDGVIADYDQTGSVRGIEVLCPQRFSGKDAGIWVNLAAKKSKGMSKITPPASGPPINA